MDGPAKVRRRRRTGVLAYSPWRDGVRDVLGRPHEANVERMIRRFRLDRACAVCDACGEDPHRTDVPSRLYAARGCRGTRSAPHAGLCERRCETRTREAV